MEGRSKATYFRIDRLLSQIRASALKSNFNSETFEEPKLYLQYSTDLKGSCYILNIFSGNILNIPENLVVDYNTGHRLHYERS